MTCQDVRPLLALRTLDVLEQDENAAVDAHLEGCPVCRSHSVTNDELIADLAKPGPAEPLPPQLWEKVAAGLDRDPPAPARRTSPLLLAMAASGLAAACFAVVAQAPASPVTPRQPLPHPTVETPAPPPKETPVSTPPKLGEITLHERDADVRAVLERLAEQSGQRVVVSPDLAGSVTVSLENVTFLAALEAIVQLRGLHATEKDGLYLVTTKRSSWGQPLFGDEAPGPVDNRLIAVVVLPGAPNELVDVQGLTPGEAFDKAGRASGIKVVREKEDRIRIEADAVAAEVKHDGQSLRLALEGVVFVKNDAHRSRAVINGRIYQEEEPLQDSSGKRLDIRVTAIREGEVEVEVGDRGERVQLRIRRG